MCINKSYWHRLLRKFSIIMVAVGSGNPSTKCLWLRGGGWNCNCLLFLKGGESYYWQYAGEWVAQVIFNIQLQGGMGVSHILDIELSSFLFKSLTISILCPIWQCLVYYKITYYKYFTRDTINTFEFGILHGCFLRYVTGAHLASTSKALITIHGGLKSYDFDYFPHHPHPYGNCWQFPYRWMWLDWHDSVCTCCSYITCMTLLLCPTSWTHNAPCYFYMGVFLHYRKLFKIAYHIHDCLLTLVTEHMTHILNEALICLFCDLTQIYSTPWHTSNKHCKMKSRIDY